MAEFRKRLPYRHNFVPGVMHDIAMMPLCAAGMPSSKPPRAMIFGGFLYHGRRHAAEYAQQTRYDGKMTLTLIARADWQAFPRFIAATGYFGKY